MTDEVNVHRVSNTILLISENQRGYKARLRDALDLILVKDVPVGDKTAWRWEKFEAFHQSTGTTKSFEYRTLHDYLAKWSRWTFDDLRKLFSDDAAMLSKLDAAVQNPVGVHTGDDIDNINVTKVPDGTSKQAALRRLRKDRPDLHQKVLDGDLSAHAAMLDAGFRRKSITVTDSNPITAASAIRSTFGPAFAAALAAALLATNP